MKPRLPFRRTALAAAGSAALVATLVVGHWSWSAFATPSIQTTSIEQDEFGRIDITYSDHEPRGLVVIAADAAHAEASRRDALALVEEGVIVASFDFDHYRAEQAKEPAKDECHYTADDVKDLGQAVQRKLNLSRYFFPLVTGRGDGAAFAFATLAQSPVNTMAGAVSIGFQPTLKSDRPYCVQPNFDPAGPGQLALRMQPDLRGNWRVIGPETDRKAAEAFQAQNPLADYVAAEDEETSRQGLVAAALQFGQGGSGATDLPVAIIPPVGPVKGLAIIVSGDGGWRDIDKSIGDWLAQRGVAVVGLDSLRYFWAKRSPGEVAADLSRLLKHYGAEYQTDRFALIGYSFGADVMPEVWPLLPRSVKDHVDLVSLLGLGHSAEFEVTVEGFVGTATASGKPIAPQLAMLPLDRTQCIYGKEEAADGSTSCTAPQLGHADRVALDGGHHFDGGYTVAAEAIWNRLKASPIRP
jgi:type IV secretory pathway VirJ component